MDTSYCKRSRRRKPKVRKKETENRTIFKNQNKKTAKLRNIWYDFLWKCLCFQWLLSIRLKAKAPNARAPNLFLERHIYFHEGPIIIIHKRSKGKSSLHLTSWIICTSAPKMDCSILLKNHSFYEHPKMVLLISFKIFDGSHWTHTSDYFPEMCFFNFA